MKRIEIIANKTVEKDILDEMGKRGTGSHYTIIPLVHGTGDTGPRQGDKIWPEENFILIVYCEEHEAALIRTTVDEIKKRYPSEGIKLFELG